MDRAGDLKFRLRFEARAQDDDGAGNVRASWVAQFTVSAALLPRTGGEEVLAARLAGVQPVIVQVRRSTDTLRIRADWRAVNVQTGEVYAITAPPVDRTGRRHYLDMSATLGVPA